MAVIRYGGNVTGVAKIMFKGAAPATRNHLIAISYDIALISWLVKINYILVLPYRYMKKYQLDRPAKPACTPTMLGVTYMKTHKLT